jgi:hypothetical protein
MAAACVTAAISHGMTFEAAFRRQRTDRRTEYLIASLASDIARPKAVTGERLLRVERMSSLANSIHGAAGGPRPVTGGPAMTAAKRTVGTGVRMHRGRLATTRQSFAFLTLNGRVEQRLTILELMLTLGRRLEASPWDRYSKPWD